MAEPYLESFSRDYAIVQNADVRTWDEGEAHMDEGLYHRIERALGGPVVGMVDGAHYYFKPSRRVLADQCAVPKGNRASDPSALLVQK